MIAYTYYESDARVIREAEAALEGGFDVDCLVLRRPGQSATEVLRGVRLLRLNQTKYRGSGVMGYFATYLTFFFRLCWHVSRLHLQRHYAAIHVNNMPDFLVFSTFLPRLLGCKVILDIHDPMPNTFLSKFRSVSRGLLYHLLLWQERLSAAYCHQVLTVHQPVWDGLLRQHGLPAAKMVVVANFPDDTIFRPREGYAPGTPLRLVFHGTILERSGLRLLVNALARVSGRDRLRVRIIGEGDFSETLKRLIRALDLGQCVEFTNSSYAVNQIPALLHDCHAGIVPLEISSVTNYALPLKLIEYISLGLPVITVRSAAISYYLQEQDCLYYQWDDPESLRNVIERLLEAPTELIQYHKRSLDIRSRFSWNREKVKYIEVLRRLTTRNGRPCCPARP